MMTIDDKCEHDNVNEDFGIKDEQGKLLHRGYCVKCETRLYFTDDQYKILKWNCGPNGSYPIYQKIKELNE